MLKQIQVDLQSMLSKVESILLTSVTPRSSEWERSQSVERWSSALPTDPLHTLDSTPRHACMVNIKFEEHRPILHL